MSERTFGKYGSKSIFAIRVLSVFLSVLMLFYAMPLTGFADEPKAEQTPFEDPYAGTGILCEDEALRERYVKYFLLADGSYSAAVYETPVHFIDSDGVWQEYDNSLYETNILLPDSLREFKPEASDIDIRISKKAKSSKMIDLPELGISWGYLDTGKSTAYILADGEQTELKNKELAAYAVENACGKVIYPEIYKNTDLEISVTSVGIKENLILRTDDVQNSFSIEYKTDKNYTPVQKNDRTVVLCDSEGNEVYAVTAPCMYDSNGRTSTALTLEITETKNKKFTLKLTADAEWLSAPDRAYPVYIDPEFEAEPYSVGTIYETTGYIYGDDPYDYISYNASTIVVGVNRGDELLGFARHSLPEHISKTSRIVKAELFMYYYYVYNGTTGFMDDVDATELFPMHINAYQVTSPWQVSNAWLSEEEMPDISSTVLDYDIAVGRSVYDTDIDQRCVSFDITCAAQSWLDEEENYGVCLRAQDMEQSYTDVVEFLTASLVVDANLPYVLYTYRDTKGLEEHMSYYSFAAGRGGAGYVNTYTGQFVKTEPLFSIAGNRDPYSVSLVYNGANAGQKYDHSFGVGYGWMLNCQQRVKAIDIISPLYDRGYHYIWTDSDGTEHYFREKTTGELWVDEDGLKLELLIEDSDGDENIVIRSDDNYRLYFELPEEGGRLVKTKDPDENSTTYTYNSSGALTQIKSASGKTTAFTYTTVGTGANAYPLLTKITDPAGRVYELKYMATHYLNEIKYPDGTYTKYYYENGQIKQINALKERIELSYLHSTRTVDKEQIIVDRVGEIREYAWDSAAQSYVEGAERISFEYIGANITHVTDAEGRVTKYLFDIFGRAVQITAPDGSVSTVKYAKTNTTQDPVSEASSMTNRIEQSASAPAYVNNHMLDPNTEADIGYYYYDYNGSTNPCSVADDEAYLGKRSLKISTDGGASFGAFMQSIEAFEIVEASKVTLSAYVKTSGVIPTDASDGTSGVGLRVTFLDDFGDPIETVCSPCLASGDNDWHRIWYTFDIPSYAYGVAVGFHLKGAAGTVWFDCAQLEPGDTVGTLNLLKNSSFSYVGEWTSENTGAEDHLGGGNYALLEGNASANKRVYQTIVVNRENVSFTFSADVTASPVTNENAEAVLKAQIKYEDNSSDDISIQVTPYCSGIEQKIVLSVVPEKKDVKIKTIDYCLVYRNNENSMRVTNVMAAVSESVVDLGYDDEGRLTSNTSSTMQRSYEYNGNGKVQKYTDENGVHHYYQYDRNYEHRLTDSFNSVNSKGYSLSYDSFGNVIHTATGYYDTDQQSVNSNLGRYIETMNVYDSTGDHLTHFIDERGLVTLYDTEFLTGLTKRITVPATVGDIDNQLITMYTYDENNYNLLTSGVYSSSAPDTLISGVTYTYNNPVAQLQMITRTDGQTYNFIYDIWGRVTSIKAGTRTLSSSVYTKADSNNTQLLYTEYGNGAKIYYGYDAFDRIISESTSAGGTPYVSYSYNNEGQIGRITDALSGTVTQYTYDPQGKLVSSLYSGTSTGKYLYTYDNSGALTAIDAYIGTYSGWNLRCVYGYNDNDQIKRSEQGNYVINYTYDYLDRLTEVKATEVSDGAEFYTRYTYLDNEDWDTTTSFVSAVEYCVRPATGSEQTVGSIKYTYDQNGYIKTLIEKNANDTVIKTESYTYDELGQLKTVTNSAGTFRYTYDSAGNILTKEKQKEDNPKEYTIIALYEYRDERFEDNDSPWNDLLASYNGQSITYDAIGNPTSYLDWESLVWSMGRRLTSLTDGENEISYAYDAAGQRISKTVNGVTTDFYYDDRGALILLSCEDGTGLYFYPEADGSIGSIGINGNRYYYVRNAQNDIIGITDKTGAFVARYTYDEWGNITSITDGNGVDVSANASHIANINPLRYRSYFYDAETGWYWLNTRYYNPIVGRFVNADGQLSTDDISGLNLFTYCGNNPVNRIDPTGEAWEHWVLGAIIVGACAVATVATCGGFAAAATAVCMVGSGVAAATTASTIAAGAFIGSAVVYGSAVFSAASTANSTEEFADQGNWGTVIATAFGGLTGGYDGYTMSKQTVADDDTFLPDSFYSKHAPKQSTPNSSYTNYTYNNYTGKYEKSTAYYDFAGRQNIRIDWTNHGYSNHGNPHVHYTTYNSQCRDGFTIRWD